MSEPYTPTTKEVRSVFSMGTIDVSVPREQSIEANCEMFDRWLDAHDAEVFRKGHEAGEKGVRKQIAREITDEMIERAAMALFEERGTGCLWDDECSCDEPTRRRYRWMARVALEAALGGEQA